MGIDFHAQANKESYVGRDAHADWTALILELADPRGKTVVDLGCGGGIYAKAWADLGAGHVIGVDFSPVMLEAAEENCRGYRQITFQQGDAASTGLEDQAADILFARALIHHLPDLHACLAEAFRLLKPGGTILLQDRTPEDVRLPGSAEHLRGYFFDCYPRLLQVEEARRPGTDKVVRELAAAGFTEVTHLHAWETRKVYADADELAADLLSRKGRSILHELTQDELHQLVSYMLERLPDQGPIVEKDRWTIWVGRRP
jgi:ubiquinone/menaquinone biosynthesis C-methylase UbiE